MSQVQIKVMVWDFKFSSNPFSFSFKSFMISLHLTEVKEEETNVKNFWTHQKPIEYSKTIPNFVGSSTEVVKLSRSETMFFGFSLGWKQKCWKLDKLGNFCLKFMIIHVCRTDCKRSLDLLKSCLNSWILHADSKKVSDSKIVSSRLN
jgi:hypothetical protein